MVQRQLLVIKEVSPSPNIKLFQEYAEENFNILPGDGGVDIETPDGELQYSDTIADLINISDYQYPGDYGEDKHDSDEHSHDGVACNPEEKGGVCICGPQSQIWENSNVLTTIIKQSVAYPVLFNDVETDLFVKHMEYNQKHGITYEKIVYDVGEDWKYKNEELI